LSNRLSTPVSASFPFKRKIYRHRILIRTGQIDVKTTNPFDGTEQIRHLIDHDLGTVIADDPGTKDIFLNMAG
jgi:hypothetical protein